MRMRTWGCERTLTFGFGFPLGRGGLAFCADLREAGQVGSSFVGLALDMQLTPCKYQVQQRWGEMAMGERCGMRTNEFAFTFQ